MSILGELGTLIWWRCRNCGFVYAYETCMFEEIDEVDCPECEHVEMIERFWDEEMKVGSYD